ncbi:MAG: tetratricopeptide repeat protein [Spirochaetaceae bacterium]
MTSIDLPLPPKRKLEETYENRYPLYEKALFELHRRLREELKRRALHPTIKYRVKSFHSYYEKLLRRVRRQPASAQRVELNDLLGLRVVCPFVEDLTAVERAIGEAFEVVEVERKGSEFSAQEFGYESTHCLVRVPADIRDSFHLQESLLWEVQLRTILQDAWAEVEHELIYKAEFAPFDEPLRRKLAALNANLTLSDIIFQEIRDYQRQLHAQLLTRREGFWRQVREEAPLPAGDKDPAPSLSPPAAAESGGDTKPPGEGARPAATLPPGEGARPAATLPPVPSWIEGELPGRESMDTMLLKALHAHNRKEYDLAIEIYTDILEHQPKPHIRGIVHIHRGMAHYAKGNLEEAIKDFSTTLAYDTNSGKAYFYRGVVHRTRGDLEAALKDFSTCLDFDQYNADALYARALVYEGLADPQAAEADCRNALSVEPDHRDAKALLKKLTAKE